MAALMADLYTLAGIRRKCNSVLFFYIFIIFFFELKSCVAASITKVRMCKSIGKLFIQHTHTLILDIDAVAEQTL